MTIHASESPGLRARITEVHPLPGVRAGSALLRIGQRLLAVQDDAFCAAWVDLPSLRITPWILHGDGAALPKKEKPDLEVAVHTDEGIVYLLGSGSRKEHRRTLLRLDPASGAVSLSEPKDLYRCVRKALELVERPNIEGACVVKQRLRLFHRGMNGELSATVDVPLAVLEGGEPEALAVHWYALGALDGVDLGFTDAAAVSERRIAFLAAAEDSTDAIADGRVTGSVLGLIDETAGSSHASWARVMEPDGKPTLRKLEGLVLDADCRYAWALADCDDPTRPAELCRVELQGFAA